MCMNDRSVNGEPSCASPVKDFASDQPSCSSVTFGDPEMKDDSDHLSSCNDSLSDCEDVEQLELSELEELLDESKIDM